MAGAGYKNWTAGDVPTAVQFDTFLQEQTVMVFANATARDTALSVPKAEGMITYQLDSNTFTVYTGSVWSTIGTAHGAMAAWAPTITQGVGVAYSAVYGTYSRVGRRIHANCRLDVTGSGTASNLVTVTLPVAAVNVADADIGGGYLFDTSAALVIKTIVATVTGGTTCYMMTTSNTGTFAATALGSGASSGFTAGLAAGDIISMAISYEAAGDA